MSDTTISSGGQAERKVAGKRHAPNIAGYDILSFVKSTSLADVWLALQVSLERNVEIWVMRSELVADESRAANFEEVYRAASRIKHPNFVQVIDVARTDEGVPYAVFEEIDGVPLDVELRKAGRIEQNKAARIVREIASVLDSAWKQCGFIHRNIKPDAVFIVRGDNVKITNFNCATLIKAGSNPLAFDDGFIVGTANYIPPEQVERLRSIDFHADMYSVGALFYEMITGDAPFAEESDPQRVMDLQCAGTVENPRVADKSIKPGLVYIMAKMMAKAPEDRYQWWQDVVEDIQKVLSGRAPYSQGGTYALPRSTIGVLPGDVPPSAAATSAPKRPTKSTKVLPADKSYVARKEGPGCFTKLLSLLFIIVVVGGVGIWRIRDLEKPPAEGEPEAAEELAIEEQDAAAPATREAREAPPRAPGTGEVRHADAAPGTEDDGQQEDAHQAMPPQKRLVGDIYRQLMEKRDFHEARLYAQRRFEQVAKKPEGYDLHECQAMWDAFRQSARFEDLVGAALSINSDERKISVGGVEIKFSVNMFANGELVGKATFPGDRVVENYKVKISDMGVDEMYAAMQAGLVPTSDRRLVLARAFLTLKANDVRKFKFYVEHNKLDGLKPFLEFAEGK